MGEHSEREHKRFSPSQTERFFRCPGSVRLCATVPPRPSSKWAAEGTKAHELLEAALENGERNAEKAWTDHSPFFAEDVDGEMCDAVQECLDYVFDLIDEHGEHVLFTETEVDPPVTSAPGEAGGHCDCGLWFPAIGWLFVIDYKHGAGIAVDVKGNTQVLSYGSGFVFGGHVPLDKITRIVSVIVQPRAFHAEGPIREASVSLAELQDYLLELDMKIDECLQPNAPLVPGEEQCRWCDASSTCPALESKALAVVGNTFQSVKDITEDRLPDPADLPVDRLAYIMQVAPVLTKWLDNVAAEAANYARMGAPVPGYKLVEAQAKRQWHGDPQELAEKLIALSGMTLDDVMPRKLLTITEADKLVSKAYKDRAKGRKAKKKAAEEATQAMAFLTLKQSSGATMLVPLTDSRPAINPASAFEQVQVIPPSK